MPKDKYKLERIQTGIYKFSIDAYWLRNKSPVRSVFQKMLSTYYKNIKCFLHVNTIYASDSCYSITEGTGKYAGRFTIISHQDYKINVGITQQLLNDKSLRYFCWADDVIADTFALSDKSGIYDNGEYIYTYIVFTDFNTDSFADPAGGFSGIFTLYFTY